MESRWRVVGYQLMAGTRTSACPAPDELVFIVSLLFPPDIDSK